MAGKWVKALSASDEQTFNSLEEWETFLDHLGLTAVQQRRWATEGVLKAVLVKKQQIKRDFNHWVTTRVDYPDLQTVLGKLMVVREELLLVLEYPWLPLHNNLMERQIREYVKRRKVSDGTRSDLGQMCRDTFASLKKTCKQHGISFAKYLKDRLSGANLLPRLKDLILQASGHQETVIAS